jgi:hypothetical protein
MAVYRNLRENYEYKLRYDEEGKFLIREMELKRNYRVVSLASGEHIIKKKSWLRHFFSLTGLHYHISSYGED